MKNRFLEIGGLVGLLLFLPACNTIDKSSKPFTKHNLTIVFKSLALLAEQNEEYQGELDAYQIDHPVDIDDKHVTNHLLSLWYQRIDSKEPQPPRPVFTKDEIKKITPLFRAALNKIDSSEYIQFEYLSRDGLIEGNVFGTVDRVHWRFDTIHGLPYSGKFLGLNSRTWRLVRITRAQRLHEDKTGLMTLARENWMVVDLKIPTLKRNYKAPVTPKAPALQPGPPSAGGGMTSGEKAIVKDKLKKLKDLLDSGLIDEADYNQKKQEILNEHF